MSKIATGVIGFTLEGALAGGFSGMSHQQHVMFYMLLIGLGLIDLLHLHMVLLEPIWAFVTPFGFILLGGLMISHKEDTPLRSMFHVISGVCFILMGLSRIVELMVGLHTKRSPKENINMGDSIIMPIEGIFNIIYGLLININ